MSNSCQLTFLLERVACFRRNDTYRTFYLVIFKFNLILYHERLRGAQHHRENEQTHQRNWRVSGAFLRHTSPKLHAQPKIKHKQSIRTPYKCILGARDVGDTKLACARPTCVSRANDVIWAGFQLDWAGRRAFSRNFPCDVQLRMHCI